MMIRKLIVSALLGSTLALGVASSADAKAVRVEKADRKGGKVLSYVEPYRFRQGVATRLYVEFRDGSAWVFTPCKRVNSRNCFGDYSINLHGKKWYA